MNKRKLLFLGFGPAITQSLAFKEKYVQFSDCYEGDIITPIDKNETCKSSSVGDFIIHPFYYYSGSSLIRNIYYLCLTIFFALKIYLSGRKYEIVISPNPLLSGITALLISKLTASKCIIEVNGNFESAFKFGDKGESKPGIGERIKERVSKIMIAFTLKHADMVKLVYSDQLKSLGTGKERNIRTTSFPNFVPISRFMEGESIDKGYVLLLGYPWFLKGVDILIKAFKKISPEFPGLKLKVVGWCPEGRDLFEDLARENPNIELCDPVYYEDVIPLMKGCSLYVLASRTDSSPRVLREAMASGKPIVASNIDGVPDLVIDGFNGLLFEKENVDDLAEKMNSILTDKRFGRELAENGLAFVRENLSEQIYIENYTAMIEKMFTSKA